MMQKFRICAGGVKVLSAKLLMGISWRAVRGVSPAYPRTGSGTQLARLCCEYGVCPEIAVEDVSAVCGEPGLQRGSAAGPARAELADRSARTPAGREDHRQPNRRRRV